MANIYLPQNKIYEYIATGKFEAPNAFWKHAVFPLSEYELIIMTEGTLYLSYAGKNYTVNTGEYLILGPRGGERKGFKEAYCSFYWLHFRPESDKFVMDFDDDHPYVGDLSNYVMIPEQGKVPKPEKMIVLMKQLQDLKKSNYPDVAINAMTTAILMELYGQLSQFPVPGQPVTMQKQVYNDILDYIETNIYENLKVSDIAEHFGYNEKYISHRFTEISGIPLKQYIMKVKMEKANFLLTDTNESIGDIAKKLSFSDAHNFCRTYKKITGLTPSDYRNAYSKRLLFHY